MPKKIRRVVTGHNEEGKSVIISDGYAPHVLALPEVEDFALTNLWVTDRSPAASDRHGHPAPAPAVVAGWSATGRLRLAERRPMRATQGRMEALLSRRHPSGWRQ